LKHTFKKILHKLLIFFQIHSQGLGKCLLDAPTETEYTYPDLPPGAMYNADLQCRLQFNSTDEDIRMCSQLDEICSQLWCSINGTCTTLLRPAADGTQCGKHKVIFRLSKLILFHNFSPLSVVSRSKMCDRRRFAIAH
jgi:hypothetical protein